MHELFESMQKAWGIPASPQLTPTLDPDEIDRRIADLQTVSQWLTVNQNMLQTTIQALQVQRATLATLQAFGQAGMMAGKTLREAGSHVPGMYAAAGDAPPPGSAASDSEPTQAADSPATTGAPASFPMPGPGTEPEQWWNVLREQFEQIANTALGSGTPTAKPTRKRASPTREHQATAPKGRPKSVSKPRQSKSNRSRES